MATSPALSALLNPLTVEQVFQILLAVYQANGFPTQSWQPGGTERTRLKAIATALTDVSSNYVPGVTAGGFTTLAPGTGWMPLLASELYNLEQEPATHTVGTINLASATGVGPITVTSGSLIVVFAGTGNRYILAEDGTIPAGPGSVDLSFVAEFAGAKYNDPSNSGALTLVTPIPGVTPTNPAGTYGEISHVGSGTGTLTLGGSPTIPHQVVVRIDSTGDSGVASWSYSVDGGAFVSAGAVPSASDIGGTGIDVTLVDGVGTPNSFIEGDTYTFATPGTWITSQGADIESDQALSQRCRDRWATLAAVGVTGLYDLLARSTPDVGAQVTQVIVQPDPDINNKLNIVIAGPAGVLPAGTISAVQSYVQARTPITVFPVVVSPSTTNVTLGGTITCQAKLFASVQLAVQVAMTNYINSVPINGTIRIARIIELLMEIEGVIDVASVTINGDALNLALGGPGIFRIASLQPLAFGYSTQ